jgi:hypothetical protein
VRRNALQGDPAVGPIIFILQNISALPDIYLKPVKQLITGMPLPYWVATIHTGDIVDASTLKEICIESCKAAYDYLATKQENEKSTAGKVTNKVEAYDIQSDGYVTLHTSGKVVNTESLGIFINGRQYFGDDVNFEYFDEIHKSITIRPCEEIMDMLMKTSSLQSGIKDDKLEINLILDLKWLITRTESYYKAYGDMIRYPDEKPVFSEADYQFPGGIQPSDQQREAVKKVLNSKLSYIWGAPGTGKTQYVLATALMACLRKNKRVAVIAPTNNSLEQVLRGLLKIIKEEDPEGKLINLKKDILRIGMATSDFVKEYPDLCEKKSLRDNIRNKGEMLRVLNDVLFEKRIEVLKSDFDQINMLYEGFADEGFFGKRKIMSQIYPYLEEIKGVISTHPRLNHIADTIDEYNFDKKMKYILDTLFAERQRPANELLDYRDWSLEKVEKTITKILQEKDGLDSFGPCARENTAKIIAVTPQTLMGRFCPKGGQSSSLQPLDIDHIFIDEVGYSNLIQSLPLFAFGVPITMLGDHMQLPPVCEIDRTDIINGIIDESELRYAFMWDQSLLYAESLLFGTIKDAQIDYTGEKAPRYEMTEQCDLTLSYRFGDNLAEVLDECVYKNGIQGISKYPLEIICIDTQCSKKVGRENEAEAMAIGKYLEDNPMSFEDFIILTPYRDQVSAIGKKFPDIKDNVTTIHKSQGKEWNTVFLSVSDNRFVNEGKECQLRFTSTLGDSSGLKVINTAVSRAKRKLVLVCDKEFWAEKEGEMIGMMAIKADRCLRFEYRVERP